MCNILGRHKYIPYVIYAFKMSMLYIYIYIYIYYIYIYIYIFIVAGQVFHSLDQSNVWTESLSGIPALFLHLNKLKIGLQNC